MRDEGHGLARDGRFVLGEDLVAVGPDGNLSGLLLVLMAALGFVGVAVVIVALAAGEQNSGQQGGQPHGGTRKSRFHKSANGTNDRLLQVTLFAWDRASNAWDSQPIAISDRGVSGKAKVWQHNLGLLADKDSERAGLWSRSGAGLPAGKYLLKVHVDVAGRLKSDWNATLGEAEAVGEAVVESGWPKGYGKMTVVEAATSRLQKAVTSHRTP